MNDPSRPADRGPARAPSLAWTVRAVGLGLICDIGATLAATLLLTAMLGGRLVGEHATAQALEQALLASDTYILLALAAGLGGTVLGGYVAARAAGEREYLHAMLAGVAVLVLGELALSQSGSAYPVAYRLIGALLTVPAALYGGHLRKRRRVPA